MKETDVRAKAFAMPLTSPAFPPGPYRFVNREYLIITYRTDPERLRAVVPEPLEVTEPAGQVRVHSHAGFDRFRRLHRNRPGHPRVVPGQTGRLLPIACSRMTSRRSPAGASCGAFRRSSPVPACAPRSTRWSAPSTTGPSGLRPGRWATSTSRLIWRRSRRRSRRAELPPEDHPACRRQRAHLRAGRILPRGHHDQRRMDRSGHVVAEPACHGASAELPSPGGSLDCAHSERSHLGAWQGRLTTILAPSAQKSSRSREKVAAS